MAFELLYHASVKDDLRVLDKKYHHRIKSAMEQRLAVAPHQYGEPLRKTFRGYWKLRVGDYRVVYKINKGEVWILGIMHRKHVYELIGKRKPSL